MRHNCLGHTFAEFWPKLGPNCTTLLCGNLTNPTFANILHPIMPNAPHHAKIPLKKSVEDYGM